MFNSKSRYNRSAQYQVRDRRGRIVTVVSVPDAPEQTIIGYHQRISGQRVDHLAAKYTLDEAGFWRIGEANGVMLIESLSEQNEIAIPNR